MREIRTADQLRRLVLEAAHEYPECAKLDSILVVARDRNKYGVSWTATELPSAKQSEACLRVLRNVAVRLARNYELKSD